MSRRPTDEDVRERIKTELDTTFIVEAAAGTGKTSTLISRILAVLRAGHRLRRIVAVTYTDKAAGEMKLRLRREIESARKPASGDAANLDMALRELEAAHIGTMHSFCADLLREMPLAAGVDPMFEVLPEPEAKRAFSEVFRAWFERVLDDPPEGVRRLLRRRPRRRGDDPPSLNLEKAAWRLVDSRDFDAPWKQEPFDPGIEIAVIVDELRNLGQLASAAYKEDDWLAIHLRNLHRWVEELDHRESVRPRDHDGLEAELCLLASDKAVKWQYKGSKGWFGKSLRREDLAERRDMLKSRLDGFVQAAEAHIAALLQQELRPVVVAYTEMKAREGKLDFLDLLFHTRELLRRSEPARRELQGRFTHIFVDEFQDTDPLQAEILLLLASGQSDVADWQGVDPVPGKLFVVGDPKQSIYRFRRADIALYKRAKDMLRSRDAQVVPLRCSFRSVPGIQAAVNAAFAPVMKEGPGQAAYVALERHRDPVPSQPAVVALPVPRPYGNYGEIADYRIEESYPTAVAAFVDFLVNRSGWQVEEAPGELVPVRPHHICILMKRFKTTYTNLTAPYVEALDARRIPHVLLGGRFYHAREETLAIRNALLAIERPDDQLAVYATLRGPLFALSDEQLLVFRHQRKTLNPLQPLDDVPEDLREVADALRLLARLHVKRNRRPIARALGTLLRETRAAAGLALWPTGEQALANVLRMMDHARKFETGGATSFRAFAEWLEEESEQAEASEAPVVEEGTEGVRIMTVHKAKGLEFPVVILADPTANLRPKDPTRYIDPERNLWAESLAWCKPIELLDKRDEALEREEEEIVRLAYVAATRARDLLVVPVVGDRRGDEEPEDWLDVLAPAVYPGLDKRQEPDAYEGFGTETVLDRPDNPKDVSLPQVAPGWHTPMVGTHKVLWWDPSTLDLGDEPRTGHLQEELLRLAEAEADATPAMGRMQEWTSTRAELLGRGAVPTLPARSVTELAEDAESAVASTADSEKVQVLSTAAPREGRPHGKRFGTLVHAVLAAVPLDADEAVVRTAAEGLARQLGATPEEVNAATVAATAALAHDVMRRAARASKCRREEPLALMLESGTVAEGIVDLAFVEGDGGSSAWTVVDFKTHVEILGRLDECGRQVRLYAEAIRRATGVPANGYLLSV